MTTILLLLPKRYHCLLRLKSQAGQDIFYFNQQQRTLTDITNSNFSTTSNHRLPQTFKHAYTCSVCKTKLNKS